MRWIFITDEEYVIELFVVYTLYGRIHLSKDI